MVTRRTFTLEFRRKLVEEHLVGGRTIAAVCREYHSAATRRTF
jgi:transposase-like protein